MVSQTGSVQLFRRPDGGWERNETITSKRAGFGWAVALPTPDQAAVGIPCMEADVGTGAVTVFDGAEEWSITATLATAGDNRFGYTLVDDGTTLVVGTLDASNNSSGATEYVQELADGTWQQTPLDLTGDQSQATTVALTANTAVVGTSGGGDRQGSAHVFERVDGDWSRQVQLVVNDAPAAFGSTVTATAGTGLAAAPSDSEYGDRRGVVYVF